MGLFRDKDHTLQGQDQDRILQDQEQDWGFFVHYIMQ